MDSTRQLHSGIEEVELLISLTPTAELEVANAVRRAAVVLLVSHFEAFLKALAEEFVDLVSTGSIESRRLPPALRSLHTVDRMNEIVSSNDEAQRRALLKQLGSAMSLWEENAKPPAGTLSASRVSRTVTSARSDVIDNLFRLFGSPNEVCVGDLDVLGADGDLEPVSIQSALQDVVGCRNSIAHGDASRLPTESDVERYVRFVRSFGDRLQSKATALVELCVT